MPAYKGWIAAAIDETLPLTAAERRDVADREGLERLEDAALPSSLVYEDSDWPFGSDSERPFGSESELSFASDAEG